MQVARAYGTRPEIFRRVSWVLLRTLASPSLPAAARLRIESRIIAGERVGAPEIRKARGALKTGRPDVKQARRMAA